MRVISFWVGTGIVWWCAFGPHVALRSGAPLEFIVFAVWVLVDSRLGRLCDLRRHGQPERSVKAIGFRVMRRMGVFYGRTSH